MKFCVFRSVKASGFVRSKWVNIRILTHLLRTNRESFHAAENAKFQCPSVYLTTLILIPVVTSGTICEKAIEYYQKSFEIRLQALGENHPKAVRGYNNIGMAFYDQGNYEQAMSYVLKALEIVCRTYNQSHPAILNQLKEVIVVAKKLPDPQYQNLKKSYTLCVETLGTEHELTIELYGLIR